MTKRGHARRGAEVARSIHLCYDVGQTPLLSATDELIYRLHIYLRGATSLRPIHVMTSGSGNEDQDLIDGNKTLTNDTSFDERRNQ